MTGLIVPPDQIAVAQVLFGSTSAVTGKVAAYIYLTIYDDEIAKYLPAQVTSHTLADGLPQSSITDLLIRLPNSTAAAFELVLDMDSTILAVVHEGVKVIDLSDFATF
jgi:hypothetical protein